MQVIGSVVGGQLVAALGFTIPLLVSACSAAFSMLYIICLPESLPKERQAKTFNWRRANTLTAMSILFQRSSLSPSPFFLPLVALTFGVGFMCFVNLSAITILYVQQVHYTSVRNAPSMHPRIATVVCADGGGVCFALPCAGV